MRHTHFRSLTNAELLLTLNSRRDHSDVIEELCQRLEEKMKLPAKDNRVECPCCEAKLFIDEDSATELFSVKLFSEVNPG